MSVSRYEFPRQTGNQAQDMKALFNAIYKIAQNLNIDLNAMQKVVSQTSVETYVAYATENPTDIYGGKWEKVTELVNEAGEPYTFWRRVK